MIAGFIDAGIGGGGMVQVSALFAAFPAIPHAQLMGSNKVAACPGMALALWRYAREYVVPWRISVATAIPYAVATAAGVEISRAMPSETFRLLVPLMLSAMLGYVLMHRDFGLVHAPLGQRPTWMPTTIGLTLGIYEGFFGPGVGMLLVFAFVRFYGFDLLRASASARVVNFAGCTTAAGGFGLHGDILWWLAVPVAATYVIGAWIGAHLAVTRGTRWLRALFVVVAVGLIARTAWDVLRSPGS